MPIPAIRRRVRLLVHIMSWHEPLGCKRNRWVWLCAFCERKNDVYCPAKEYMGKPLEKHPNYIVEVVECSQHY